MVIRSTGSFTRGGRRSARAIMMDRLPSRPQNIMTMITSRFREDSSRVI